MTSPPELEPAVSDPTGDDPAAIGFALLMAGVEAAISSSTEEIAALRHIVDQSAAGVPAVTPPALQPAGVRPAATSTLPAVVPPRPTAIAAEPPAASVREAAEHALSPLPVSSVSPSEFIAAASQEAATEQTTNISSPAVAPLRQRSADLAGIASKDAPARTGLGLVAPVGGVRSGVTLPTSLAAVSAPQAGEASAAAVAPQTRAAFTEQAPMQWPDGEATQPPFVTAAAPPGGGAGELAMPAVSLAPSAMPGRSVAPVHRDAPSASAQDGAAGPTHGDVYLDGARVGHWMSEVLARAAGGPARGSTGFDARMGARWPGALQGR